MAIESLTDRIFTTQSDVWSYGVVLWELFSLGKMPYSGKFKNKTLILHLDSTLFFLIEITVLKDLIRLLLRGERLETPSLMPDHVSGIMAKCWENDPKKRPTFSLLEEELGSMLGDDVQNHYLKMNDPYMQMTNSGISASGYTNNMYC